MFISKIISKKRLADEVAIDDILPGYEQNQKERQGEIKNEAEIAADNTEEQELQDIPLVEEESQDAEEKSETEAAEISEITAVEVNAEDENSAKEDSETNNINDKNTEIENTESIQELKTAENTEESAEVVPETSVAELIEASLKNDEEYIKGISQDKQEDEIPLNEDDWTIL